MPIELSGVSKRYGNKTVFDNLTVKFDDCVNVIMGESGSGKTTLLNVIAGLTDYDGTVVAPKVSFIFQDGKLVDSLTVLQNVELVLLGVEKDKAKRIAVCKEFLTAVGLVEHANKYPDQLSGGEAQRVAIARAFAYPSGCMLVDEPFASLDYSLIKKLSALFLFLYGNTAKPVVWVTHNIDEALAVGKVIWKLKGGVLSEICKVDDQQRSGKTDYLLNLRRIIESKLEE